MSDQDTKTIIVSAPGKIILHGEHAVMYGKMALACSLNLKTFLWLKPIENDIVLTIANLSICRRWTVKEITEAIKLPLGNALTPAAPTKEQEDELKNFLNISHNTVDSRSLGLMAFLYLLCAITYKDKKLPAIYICITSDLPISSGLGSSASFAVCLASSFLTFSGSITKPIPKTPKIYASWSRSDRKLINSWALEAEKIIHGNSSGLDNTVCTYGGALTFCQGKIEFLQKIPELRILLIDSKHPRSTQTLEDHVKRRYQQLPCIISPIFESIEAVTEKCQSVLQLMGTEDDEDKYELLENLIDVNQQLLNVLGVSHKSLDKIHQITGRFGIHSKMTGAGGGGCSVALIKPGTPCMLIKMMKDELEKEEFECFEISIGMPGVLFYNKLDITVKLSATLYDK